MGWRTEQAGSCWMRQGGADGTNVNACRGATALQSDTVSRGCRMVARTRLFMLDGGRFTTDVPC